MSRLVDKSLSFFITDESGRQFGRFNGSWGKGDREVAPTDDIILAAPSAVGHDVQSHHRVVGLLVAGLMIDIV